MNNIVNGGSIILVAAFGLVAIVGGADEFRELSGPASGQAEPDAASADRETEPSDVRDLGVSIPGKQWRQGLGDDRDDREDKEDREDKRGEGERKRDRDDDRRGDDDDDDDDDEKDDKKNGEKDEEDDD